MCTTSSGSRLLDSGGIRGATASSPSINVRATGTGGCISTCTSRHCAGGTSTITGTSTRTSTSYSTSIRGGGSVDALSRSLHGVQPPLVAFAVADERSDPLRQ